MTGRLPVLVAVALAASISLMAQDRGQQQYNAAYDAWDAGRYPEALKGFQQLLGTPDGERFVEPIALLTGELYRSIEVVPPNRLVVDSSAAVNGPHWSPDGRHFAFESTAAGRRTIRIYRDTMREQIKKSMPVFLRLGKRELPSTPKPRTPDLVASNRRSTNRTERNNGQ